MTYHDPALVVEITPLNKFRGLDYQILTHNIENLNQVVKVGFKRPFMKVHIAWQSP